MAITRNSRKIRKSPNFLAGQFPMLFHAVLWVLEETRKTVSELKSLVDSEKFRVIVFQYRAKNDNSEFSLPSMIPYVKVKFQVIVLGIRQKTITWNSDFHFQA